MTWTLTGNGGQITAGESGEVLSYEPSAEVAAGEHDGYGDIVKLDSAEWLTFLARHGLQPCPPGDMPNIGYWTRDGSYHAPAHDYRAVWLPDALAGRPSGAIVGNSGLGALFSKS